MAFDMFDVLGIVAVELGQSGEALSEVRAVVLPAAYADVQMIAFGEYPAVAALQPSQVETDNVSPFSRHSLWEVDVAFYGNLMPETGSYARKLGCLPIAAVCRDKRSPLKSPV